MRNLFFVIFGACIATLNILKKESVVKNLKKLRVEDIVIAQNENDSGSGGGSYCQKWSPYSEDRIKYAKI